MNLQLFCPCNCMDTIAFYAKSFEFILILLNQKSVALPYN